MPNKSFVEDMVTLAGGVLNNLAEQRHELKAQARAKAGNVVRKLDLVTREEFDAAFAMLSKARSMQEELHDRLKHIEIHLGVASKSPTKSSHKGATHTAAKTASKAKSSAKSPVKTKFGNLPSVKTKKVAPKARRTGKRR